MIIDCSQLIIDHCKLCPIMMQQDSSEIVQESRDNTAVIFLHIPKTAGTTLLEILDRQYPPESIFSLGVVVQKSIAEFKDMDEESRGKIRLLRGHMGYGLHEFFPGPTQYFTLLRDPVARVISHFNFIRRTPDHYLHERVVTGDLTLHALLQKSYAQMLNDAQVRLISGVWSDPFVGEVTPAMLEIAKTHLADSFAVVGLTEQFDKTLLLLKETFNWPASVTYLRQNVTQNGLTMDSLPAETIERIRQFNRQDQALYEFGRELFKEQCARQGPDFELRVRNFQRVNKYGQLLQRLRTFSVRTKLREWAGISK
jgi:hypothetical protein